MSMQWNSVALESLGVLRARGADAVRFLQGQLSNDMTRLSAGVSLLAGYHNPQGRTIALLRLVQLAPDDLLAILPRELVAPVAARLGKFTLRSRVKLTDESALWQVEGLLGRESVTSAAAAAAGSLPVTVGGVRRVDDTSIVRIGTSPARLLVVRPLAAAPALDAVTAMSAQEWQLSTIAAAEPQVYGVTSEEFVAQMLNLDVLDAIAFDKGCYTGQEVIARSHYRGRVKRRMQRFLTDKAVTLHRGDSGELRDGRPFKVVECAQHADGRCEFLAVTSRPIADGSGAAAAPSRSAVTVIEAAELELPYALPQ